MKKLLVVSVLTLLITFSVNAQWKLGIKGGLNVTGFNTESLLVTEQTPAPGYFIGALVQCDLGKGFYFMPELRFSQRAISIDDANDKLNLQQYAGLSASDPTLLVNTQFLELPINFQFRFKVKTLRVFSEIGPQVAFRLSGNFNGDASACSSYGDAFAFRKIDYGVGLGAGVEYKHLLFGARWDWLFNRMGNEYHNPISNTGNENTFFNMKYLNGSLSAAYVF